VGDISGKGISAALLMASLQALLRSHAPYRRQELARLMSDVNRLLCAMTDDSRFATCFYSVFDTATGSFSYVNAGHNPPLLFRGSKPGPPEKLTAGGLMLGIFEDSSFEENRLPFDFGDTLVVYTDGIVEARNSHDEEFGEERLESVLQGCLQLTAREILQKVVDEVQEFAVGQEQGDDLTLVVVRHI
jgi:sigma-B regulation protein RsbU (phosphoserine phosphatase)